MRFGGDLIPIDSKYPFGGLSASIPSTMIEANLSPSMLNMLIRNGILLRRSGYYQLGQRLVGGIRRLVEPNIVEAGTGNLINNLVVLTTRRQYAYDDSTGGFVDLTPDLVSYPLTGIDQANKKFTISGNHAAEFNTERPFPVVDSTTGNDGIYTVASASDVGGDTEITVSETIPSGTLGGGSITIATDWVQTPSQGFIDYATVTDNTSSRLIITNGVETPRYWSGDLNVSFADWVPQLETFQTCKTLSVFKSHLFMGGIVDQSHEPALIGWSDVGNSDDFSLGTSGLQVLTGVVGQVRRMISLGDRLVIYSDDSIITGVFVGLPAVFAFDTVIAGGTRLSSENNIVSIDVGHIFPSEENFYLFDGTRALRRVGDSIREEYKKVRDLSNLHLAAGYNDYARGTAYFAVPNIDGNATVYTLEYDPLHLDQLVWGEEVYSDTPTAFGFYTKRTVLDTWQDNVNEQNAFPNGVTWEEDTGSWFDESEQIGFPSRVFGTGDGKVFLASETTPKDRGVAFDSIYETKDFTVPQADQSHIGRWMGLEFEASGDLVEISYSLDKGITYIIPPQGQSVSLSSRFSRYDVGFDVASRTFRLRFKVSSGDFKLRWIRLWVRPGGPT